MLASDLKESALVLGLVKTWENYMWNTCNTQNSFWWGGEWGEHTLFSCLHLSEKEKFWLKTVLV